MSNTEDSGSSTSCSNKSSPDTLYKCSSSIADTAEDTNQISHVASILKRTITTGSAEVKIKGIEEKQSLIFSETPSHFTFNEARPSYILTSDTTIDASLSNGAVTKGASTLCTISNSSVREGANSSDGCPQNESPHSDRLGFLNYFSFYIFYQPVTSMVLLI